MARNELKYAQGLVLMEALRRSVEAQEAASRTDPPPPLDRDRFRAMQERSMNYELHRVLTPKSRAMSGDVG